MVDIYELADGMRVVIRDDISECDSAVPGMYHWCGKEMTIRDVIDNGWDEVTMVEVTMVEDAGECPDNPCEHHGWYWSVDCIDHIVPQSEVEIILNDDDFAEFIL